MGIRWTHGFGSRDTGLAMNSRRFASRERAILVNSRKFASRENEHSLRFAQIRVP